MTTNCAKCGKPYSFHFIGKPYLCKDCSKTISKEEFKKILDTKRKERRAENLRKSEEYMQKARDALNPKPFIIKTEEMLFVNCDYCSTRYDANKNIKCPTCNAPTKVKP